MKKHFISILIGIMIISPMVAKISFGDLDLNQNDELLFTVSQDMIGTKSYSSLFYTKIKNGECESNPEIITCYPEKMELLNNGTNLQIRNRYGIGHYDIIKNKFNWIEKTEGMPVKSLPLSPYSVSPDGKWICKVEKKSFSSGDLVIQNAKSGKKAILCEDVRQSFDDVAVKWSFDSSVLLYEKDNSVYFCNPQAVISGVEMEEKYRKIGRGSINSVFWASDRILIYIDDYLIYQINSKEMYTIGLYSGVIGQGKAIARLPFQFNSATDSFSVNEKMDSYVVIQNNRLFTYLKTRKNNVVCDYLDVIYSKPYSDSDASLVDSFIFWDEKDNPILWMEKLPYDGKNERGSVYKLGKDSNQVLEISDSGKPFISPDGTKVAFFAATALYVYDINTWQRLAVYSGERILSAIWAGRNVLFIGGEKTIRKWNFVTNSNEVLYISSAEKGYWNELDNTILADLGNKDFYKYDIKNKSWMKTLATEESSSVQNGKYRVFTGTTVNSYFENALYVRTLSNKAVTKAIYKESIQKKGELKKVALVFDAYDNADGLARILSTLKKYELPGTFFLNGEFIRRYPMETKQIVNNGYEVGSMYFSTIDLENNPFIVDESFVRRGLARNEDEFFMCTNKELSLIWHAPFYSAGPNVVEYGRKAGYRYVDSVTALNDCEKLDKNIKPEKIIHNYCDMLKKNGGGIVPVSVGFSQGNRTEPLYNYLDILLCALIDEGFEFVGINDL